MNEDKRAGLLYGSFCADALSLGVHWIYDSKELAQKHGRINEYKTPGPDSYHPHKQAGEQGHVGDQALCLLRFLSKEKMWNNDAFMNSWLAIWPDYNDYVDGATKTTLGNLQNQSEKTQGGSDSVEIAGPARISPLVCHHANSNEEEVVRSSVEQTMLTHRSAEAEESTVFLAKAGYRLIHGANLSNTLKETAPAWAMEKAKGVFSENAVDAVTKLGPACSISSALPSVLYLALKYENDIENAFIENAMAGGDNCARGLALGMLLGAANGCSSIPRKWIDSLMADKELENFLNPSNPNF